MLQRIRIALLGAWLGAMALFSFGVAPAAFAVLPAHLAGQVVSRVLSTVEIAGIFTGVVLIVCLACETSRQSRLATIVEAVLLALMTLSTLVSRYVVSARLHAIRLGAGENISALPSGDPARAMFDLLHQASVGLMSFNLIAAIVLIGLLISRAAGQAASIPTTQRYGHQ
jgi:hypothetical protein